MYLKGKAPKRWKGKKDMKKHFTNNCKEKAFRYWEDLCNKGYCPRISKTRTGWLVSY